MTQATAPSKNGSGQPPFREYLDAGLSIVPIRGDGSKRPCVEWKPFTRQRATPLLAKTWELRYHGVAVVGGVVSVNLEILDIDEPALVEQFEQLLELESPGLLGKLTRVRTPRADEEGRHGRHYFYRCEVTVDGNKKLAMSEPRPQFNADGSPILDARTGAQIARPECMIETRGEGGYAVTVGSAARCHPTGNLYEHVGGPPLTALSVLSEAELATIHRVARSFDKAAMSQNTGAKTREKQAADGERPGDAFNRRASWDEILGACHWTRTRQRSDGVCEWCRPGKAAGVSGTTGLVSKDGNELFTCFSQNAHPFEGVNAQGTPGKTYTKFAAYAVVHHNGDFAAATKELGKQGYGEPGKKKSKAAGDYTARFKPAAATAGSADPLAIERAIADRLGIYVMGETATRDIVVFSRHQRKIDHIRNVSNLKFPDLLQIGGHKIREHVIESADGDIPPNMITIADVRKVFALLASQRRVSPELSCGQGFYLGETKKAVIVDGGVGALWDYDTKMLSPIREPFADGLLLDFEGARAFSFRSLDRRLGNMDGERAAESVRHLDRILAEWTWRRPGAHTLAAGLVLATMVQTAWKWRPQVAVTGESNSGKTILLETLAFIFGGLADLSAKPSEAGLRQSIGSRAAVILIDEMERSSERRKIFELIRTASRGSKILRGTVSGRAMAFGLRHIVWLGSVEIGLVRQPDRNRFIRLEIQPPNHWMDIPDEETLVGLGKDLFAAAVYYCRDAVAVCGQIKRAEIPNVDQRTVESYAAPAAMLAVTGMFPHATPEAILRSLIGDTGDQAEIANEPDQLILLRDILALRSVVDRVILTAGEILDNPYRYSGSSEVLERDGIKRHGDKLFIAPKLVEPRLKGSAWEGQSVGEILARLPGAETGGNVRLRCASVRQYGVMVPWEIVDQIIAGDEAWIGGLADEF